MSEAIGAAFSERGLELEFISERGLFEKSAAKLTLLLGADKEASAPPLAVSMTCLLLPLTLIKLDEL